jgi:hypothetical protein
MFWDKKKIITLSVLGVLAILAFATSYQGGNSKVLNVEPNYFAIKDTLSIRKIVIADNQNNTVELNTSTGAWMVNNQHRASELNLTKLLYIIKHVTANRELTGTNAAETISKIKKEGFKISIFGANGLLKEYITDNGDITSSSCFYDAKTQKVCFVELPAYTDDFSRFFKADANQWRSRLVCTNNLKDLESITSNLEGKIVKLTYNGSFFDVPNVTKIDSNTVGMYLLQFRNLECDQFLSDSSKKYCSTDFTKAFAFVSIKDIDSTKNNKLYFFEIPQNKKQFLGYSTALKECFWIAKNKTLDLLIDSEKLFEKRKEN